MTTPAESRASVAPAGADAKPTRKWWRFLAFFAFAIALDVALVYGAVALAGAL